MGGDGAGDPGRAHAFIERFNGVIDIVETTPTKPFVRMGARRCWSLSTKLPSAWEIPADHAAAVFSIRSMEDRGPLLALGLRFSRPSVNEVEGCRVVSVHDIGGAPRYWCARAQLEKPVADRE